MAYELICQKCGTIGELEDPIDEFECPNCGGRMLPEGSQQEASAAPHEHAAHDDSTPTIAISRSQIQEYRNVKIAKTADLGFGGVVNAKLSASTRGIPVANVGTGNVPKIGAKSDKPLIVNAPAAPVEKPQIAPPEVHAIHPAVEAPKPAAPAVETPAPEVAAPQPTATPVTPSAPVAPAPAPTPVEAPTPAPTPVEAPAPEVKVEDAPKVAETPVVDEVVASEEKASETEVKDPIPTPPPAAAAKKPLTKNAPKQRPEDKPIGGVKRKPAAATAKKSTSERPASSGPRQRKGTGKFEIDRSGKVVRVFAPNGAELTPEDTRRFIDIHNKKRKKIAFIVIGITVLVMGAICGSVLLARSIEARKDKERKEKQRIEATKTPEYLVEYRKFESRIPSANKLETYPKSYAEYTELITLMKGFVAKYENEKSAKIQSLVRGTQSWILNIERHRENYGWGWPDSPK